MVGYLSHHYGINGDISYSKLDNQIRYQNLIPSLLFYPLTIYFCSSHQTIPKVILVQLFFLLLTRLIWGEKVGFMPMGLREIANLGPKSIGFVQMGLREIAHLGPVTFWALGLRSIF